MDRLIARLRRWAPEAFQQKPQLASPRQQIAANESTQAAGKLDETLAQEQEPVLAGRVAGLQQTFPQAKITREGDGGWLGVEKAIGADLELEALLPQGPGRAAGPLILLQ